MCGCRNGNSTPQSVAGQKYEVSLPNGQSFTVDSEHEARVAITRAGGGDFRKAK